MDPVAMLEGRETLEDAWKFVRENWGIPVLVYSSDTARNVKEVQQYGQERVAEMLEQAAAKLAERAVPMESGEWWWQGERPPVR